MYLCKRASLEALATDTKNNHNITLLSEPDWRSLLDNTTHIDDVISMDGEYFQYSTWLVSHVSKKGLTTALGQSNVCVTSESDTNGVIKGLSLSTLTSAPCGQRLDYYYYGRDTELCISHLVAQITHNLTSSTSYRFGVMIMVPSDVDRKKLERFVTSYLGKRFGYYEKENPTELLIMSEAIPVLSSL